MDTKNIERNDGKVSFQVVVDAAAFEAAVNKVYLRSRGRIDGNDSYKCAENFEGHAIVDNKLSLWKLNEAIGIRPVICVNEADIVEMQ